MAPSSLKKMRRSMRGREGNYASDPNLRESEATNTDLGLTLLPGSQIQKGNDRDIWTASHGRHAHSIPSRPPDYRQRRSECDVKRAQTSSNSAICKYQQKAPPPNSSTCFPTSASVVTSSIVQNADIVKLNYSSRPRLVKEIDSKIAAWRSYLAPTSEIELDGRFELTRYSTASKLTGTIISFPARKTGRLEALDVCAGTNSGHAYGPLQMQPKRPRSVSVPAGVWMGCSNDTPYASQTRPQTRRGYDVSIWKHVPKVKGKVSRSSWTSHFPATATKNKSEDVTSPLIFSSLVEKNFPPHKKQNQDTHRTHTSSFSHQRIDRKQALHPWSRTPGVSASSPQGHDAEPVHSFQALKPVYPHHDIVSYIRRSRSLPNLRSVRQSNNMSSSPIEHQLLTPPRETLCLTLPEHGDDVLLDSGQDSFDYQLQQTLLPTHDGSSLITYFDPSNAKSPSVKLPNGSPSATPKQAESPDLTTHIGIQSIDQSQILPAISTATQQSSAAPGNLGPVSCTGQVPVQTQKSQAWSEKLIQSLREQLHGTERDIQALSNTHKRLENAYHDQLAQNTVIKDRAIKAERTNRALEKQLATSRKENVTIQTKYDELVTQLQGQLHHASNGTQCGEPPVDSLSIDFESGATTVADRHEIGQVSNDPGARAPNKCSPFAVNDLQELFPFSSPAQTQNVFSSTPYQSRSNDNTLFDNHAKHATASSTTPFEDPVTGPRDMIFNRLDTSMDALFSNEQLATDFAGQNLDVIMPDGDITTEAADQTIDLTEDFFNSRDSSTHSRQSVADYGRSGGHTRSSSMSEAEKRERKRLSNQAYRENERQKRKLAFMLGEDTDDYKREVAKLKTATGRESRAGNSPKAARSRPQTYEADRADFEVQSIEQNRDDTNIVAFTGSTTDFGEVMTGSLAEAIDSDEAAFAATLEAELANM